MRGSLALSALAFLSIIPQIFAEAATVRQTPISCTPGGEETLICNVDGKLVTYVPGGTQNPYGDPLTTHNAQKDTLDPKIAGGTQNP